ncbi:penicillin amidase, partial [Cellulomonas bogoriensis 69B4 = DSM 16987]
MGSFEVLRDEHGIPHVRAGDELALARGQGYVTARDRAWQIEVDRWRAEGRAAEHLGPAALPWDVFAHQVRLPCTARRAYDALDPADRAWVDAYVEGVNAGLVDGRDTPEMRALAGLPGPAPAHEPWPRWAPLGVFQVSHVLFSNLPHLLWRDHLVQTLGPAHPDLDPVRLLEVFAADGGPTSGSNAWALHGSRTRSGLPLLAGDPHRVLELPGVYQQVRLACPEYDVLGMAFPGVPGISHMAHAGTVAWGITNAVAHHVEVFRERLTTLAGQTRAQGPNGTEPVTRGTVDVQVRHADGVRVHRVPWAETARGPVVTGLAVGAGPDETVVPTAPDVPTFSVRMPA